jgi:hypothetical protein
MKCEKCSKFYNGHQNVCPCTLKRSGQFGGHKTKCAIKDTSESGATRNQVKGFRHDLLVWEFLDLMASVMDEGVPSHGENNWRQGFDNEGRDIWNHVFNHHRQWRSGDRSEPHLAKMAIGCMFQWFFDQKREEEKDVDIHDLRQAAFLKLSKNSLIGVQDEQETNKGQAKCSGSAFPDPC